MQIAVSFHGFAFGTISPIDDPFQSFWLTAVKAKGFAIYVSMVSSTTFLKLNGEHKLFTDGKGLPIYTKRIYCR
jgi:hypothetical protein